MAKIDEPVTTTRAMLYKRNLLLVSVLAILTLVPGVNVNEFKPFGVGVGDGIWWVGAALLFYHGVMYFAELYTCILSHPLLTNKEYPVYLTKMFKNGVWGYAFTNAPFDCNRKKPGETKTQYFEYETCSTRQLMIRRLYDIDGKVRENSTQYYVNNLNRGRTILLVFWVFDFILPVVAGLVAIIIIFANLLV